MASSSALDAAKAAVTHELGSHFGRTEAVAVAVINAYLQAESDTDRQQMLFEREEIARRDEEMRLRRMSPAELAVKYAPDKPSTIVLQPEAVRDFYFGTDIPRPTWREVEEARAMRGEDDAGHQGNIVIFALFAIIIVAAAIRVII